MSLILKGVDLPTNGETLIVGIYGDGNVSIEYSKPLVLAIKPNVQAIQIPNGHGDIKDVGRVVNYLEDTIRREGLDPWCEINAVLELIDDAPTILESET